MLRALSIRNILLIEKLDLDFSDGLNVLTGETGAGKSILLDCLGFVLGWRGRAELVRQGADQGEVIAEFALSKTHAAHEILEDAGFPPSDHLILRRLNTRDGRKRAFINDRAASGEVLRALSDALVEIHGQQDDRGLLDPKQHRQMLDSFGGYENLLEDTREAWRTLAKSRRALKTAREALEAAAQDKEYLQHATAELEKLAPQTGEDAALDQQRRLMQAAARIREDVVKAGNLISSEGAEAMMGDALRWLETAADKADGRLEQPVAALARALGELADAQMGIEAALEGLDFNPYELEQIEERLFAIRALARKHNVAPDDLAALAEDFNARLAAIETGADNLVALEVRLSADQKAYDALCSDLSAARQAAAEKLDSLMLAELAPLKMERAVFTTEVSPTDAGAEGADAVAFTVATNPGAPSGPINRIASGGELSRFLLALKVCLTQRSDDLTMIFDEIDRGVGGATADAVGRRLAAIAEKGQVLVVTHSPQVAALGAHHFRVAKSVEQSETRTAVAALDATERVDEIARMLAGEIVTTEARAAARALLDR